MRETQAESEKLAMAMAAAIGLTAASGLSVNMVTAGRPGWRLEWRDLATLTHHRA